MYKIGTPVMIEVQGTLVKKRMMQALGWTYDAVDETKN